MKNRETKTNKKPWLVGIAIFVGLYLISLFVPFLSNVTKYPYYFVKCGGQPITATRFAAAYSYTVPGGKVYDTFSDTYFCSEQEAKDAGFRKYP